MDLPLVFSRIVSTYDEVLTMRYCFTVAVHRPVFVTETWRVIISRSSTSRVAINSHRLHETFIVVVKAWYRYTQWQYVFSVFLQCDFLHQ